MLEFPAIIGKLSEFSHAAGSKALAEALRPKIEIEEIRTSLKETEAAVSLLLRYGSAPIYELQDIRGALNRGYTGSILSFHELLLSAELLRTSAAVKKYVGSLPEGEENILIPYSDRLYSNRILEQDIFCKILSEDEMADDASPALYQLRRQIRDRQNSIKDKLNAILQGHGKAVQESVVTMRGERYCIPVKVEYRNAVPGIVHDTSSTGQTLFIEPSSVVDTNNKIRELRVQEEVEMERIAAELSAEVSAHHEALAENYRTLCYLDFTFAKARLALAQNAVMPDINSDGIVSIVKGRHPLLDPKKAVPLNFRIGADYTSLLITGPNTGGKTVALKTVGLLTLMMQSGLLVPAASGTVLSVFRGIYADIGDEQSISQNLSTFSAHMQNIVEILSVCDYRSLLLFDELGAGTDPTEGAALAMSILECVHQTGCTTVATTHYSELKVFASTAGGFENACCEFDVETLQPTYKLLIGIPGKSNAFAISEKIGLDPVIVERAKELISAEDLRFEDMLSNIEKTRKVIEEEQQKAVRLRTESELLQKRAAEEQAVIAQKRSDLLAKAREEARTVLREAKQEADTLLKEIRRASISMGSSDALRQSEQNLQALNKLQRQTEAALYEGIETAGTPDRPPASVKPGDLVKVLTMGGTGEVLKEPDKDGNVYLQMGIMKLYVPLQNLRMDDAASVKKEKKTPVEKRTLELKSTGIRTELDLRGCMVEEALLLLDKYMDDARLAHLSKFTIIHGKGTGALRAGIHQHLKGLKGVKEFRIGAYGEGDAGVTVVTLK